MTGDGGADTGYTVAEAAAKLGVSKDALYKRVRRGTIRFERGSDGVVRVWLPAPQTAAPPAGSPEVRALLAEKDARIASLERQLDVRAEEARRWSVLLAQMNDRLKALREPEMSPAPRPSWWKRLFWGPTGVPPAKRR